MKILVICLGNINRSPLVAALLARSLRAEVRSAGFLASGKRASARMRAAAIVQGVSLEEHRSNVVNGKLYEWADVIVYFSESHRKRLEAEWGTRFLRNDLRWCNLAHYLQNPQKSVADPAFNSKFFDQIVTQLVEGSRALAKELKKNKR